MKNDEKYLAAEGMPCRLNNRLAVGKVPSAALAVLALSAAAAAHARAPSAADKAFCDRYALIMQQALDVDRSGDPGAIAQFRQTVSRDPQAYLIMPGLGVSMTTPPWITDVTVQSREHCLDQVRLNIRGWLPDDPERPKPENTPENHVGTITVLPSNREAPAAAPTAPPNVDTFVGAYSERRYLGSNTVRFQRHNLLCLGGLRAAAVGQTLVLVETCTVRETPNAYVVKFPQSSGLGEVTVPFSTMRPFKADAASTQ